MTVEELTQEKLELGDRIVAELAAFSDRTKTTVCYMSLEPGKNKAGDAVRFLKIYLDVVE